MKNNKVMIAAGAAAVIVLAVLSFLWVYNRHKEIEAQKSPSGVFKRFNNALLSGNIQEAWSFLSEKSVKNAVNFDNFKEKAEKLLKNEEYKAELKSTQVAEEKKDGDKIILKIKYAGSGNQQDMRTGTIVMVNEKGVWKIDFTASSSED
ncbi:MAG: hypothetical protein LWY06_03345 [Firmicutes bacterium]|nr:hypothetical protein [Bacillota bacterium]